MPGQEVAGLVLAAGKGTRMRSARPKVLHELAGKPLVRYVVEALQAAGVGRIFAVVGYAAAAVQQELGEGYTYIEQPEQLGTGHAVQVALPCLPPEVDRVLIVPGDAPLVQAATLRALVEQHLQEGAGVALLTAILDAPAGYGRVQRDAGGRVTGIVEEKDATSAVLAIREVNSGIYCWRRQELASALAALTTDNAQGEYYLTDAVGWLAGQGGRVATLATGAQEIMGINTRADLARGEKLLRKEINRRWMERGVTIVDPAVTYIDAGVEMEPDVVVYPFCLLQGKTSVGSGCRIGPGVTLRDTVVGRDSVVIHAVVIEAWVGQSVQIGPYAYLRPGTVLADRVKIGDFVEVKNSTVGEGSKVPHLSYLGDSQVGREVNIGAGTITCNYDGRQKWPTYIEDGAFVGSNTNLVAPVRVGREAVTGAGSTITKNVPPGSLGVGRGRQVNILRWKERQQWTKS